MGTQAFQMKKKQVKDSLVKKGTQYLDLPVFVVILFENVFFFRVSYYLFCPLSSLQE